MIFTWTFFTVLVLLGTFDLRWKLLPIEVMTFSLIVFACWNVLRGGPSVTSMFIGVVVATVFLGGQVVISHGRWMGRGDPLLGMLIGVALGWPLTGYALYFTYVGGGLLMLVLFLAGIVKRGERIPFAPMLGTGAVLALWLGPGLHRILHAWWVG